MASQSVVASMSVKLNITETLSTGLASVAASSDLVPAFSWVAGNTATANGVSQYFANSTNTITLNSGANTTLTLTALTDASGSSRTLVNGVRGFMIYVTSRSAGDFLTVGNSSANSWTGFVSVNTATFRVYDFHASAVMNTDKLAVSSTSNQLRITNAGSNAITFKVALWGND
jgi:hypothetical protein